MISKARKLYNWRRKNPAQLSNAYSSQVNWGLLTHPAFLALTPAAQLICIIMHIEHSLAIYHKQKTTDGHPYFKWSAEDSTDKLKISGRNHFKAVAQLKALKFIAVAQPGGLKGCNGTPNFFILQSGWEREKPERKPTSAAVMAKMADARKKRLDQQQAIEIEDSTPPVNTVSRVQPSKRPNAILSLKTLAISTADSPLQPGQMAYYKRPEDRRALKAELVTVDGDVWTVKGARRAGKFTRELLSVPAQYILPAATVQNDTAKNKRHVNTRAIHQ